jgi:lipopolysaccharide transport system permease protein
VILQFWFWLTPVVYPISILPASVTRIIQYNPMVPLLTAYQDIVVQAKWPVWSSLWPVALLALALCFIGMRLFRKHAGEMVDEL